VIRIRRALKIVLMARETIRRRAGETIVRVALIASNCEMRAGERKTRAIVIEAGGTPRIVVMARQTILRIIAGGMIRIGGLLIIRLMAGKAIRRRTCETIVDMALVASHRRVNAEQGKTRTAVIKGADIAQTNGLPSGNRAAVALLTAHRKTGQLVIRIRRGFIILAMANPALQRHVDEFALALRSMAIITADMLVPPEQWKTRGLMYDRHFRYILP
jgi:hypothetical protein